MDNLDTDTDHKSDGSSSDNGLEAEEDAWNFDLITSALAKIRSTQKLDMYQKRMACKEIKAMCTSLYEELNERPRTSALADWFYKKEDIDTNDQLTQLHVESQRLLRMQRERRLSGEPQPPKNVHNALDDSDALPTVKELKERLILMFAATYTPNSDPLRQRLLSLEATDSHAVPILCEAVERLGSSLSLYQNILKATTAEEQRGLEKQWKDRTEDMGLYYPSEMWRKK